jgi:hypothetical protein
MAISSSPAIPAVREFPSINGPFPQFRVNHAFGVTGLASLVRHPAVRLRAMPPISLNLGKIAHFWIATLSVPFMEPWMGNREHSSGSKTVRDDGSRKK